MNLGSAKLGNMLIVKLLSLNPDPVSCTHLSDVGTESLQTGSLLWLDNGLGWRGGREGCRKMMSLEEAEGACSLLFASCSCRC